MTKKSEEVLFEGTPVREMILGVTGKTGEAPGVEAHHIGDEVTVLVVGVVTKITHAEADIGLQRIHTVKLAEAHLLEEHEASELLASARDNDRRLLDEMLGRQSLFEDGRADPETGEVDP